MRHCSICRVNVRYCTITYDVIVLSRIGTGVLSKDSTVCTVPERYWYRNKNPIYSSLHSYQYFSLTILWGDSFRQNEKMETWAAPFITYRIGISSVFTGSKNFAYPSSIRTVALYWWYVGPGKEV